MAEFVRAQIFGTTFEITSRFVVPQCRPPCRRAADRNRTGTPTCSPSAWALSASYGMLLPEKHVAERVANRCACVRACSSAKDQLTGQAVAVKKIMKPFSTPVLSKRTYRELKLLKHLRHENVRLSAPRQQPR